MKRYIMIMLMAFMLATLTLSACNTVKDRNEDSEEYDIDDDDDVKADREKKDKKKKKDKDKDKEKDPEKEDKDPDKDKDKDKDDKKAVKDGVIGNGTYFVSVDGKIYYREYDPYAFGDGNGLNGNFLEFTYVPNEADFVCYDPETGEKETIAKDIGRGPLFYSNGYFYLTKNTEYTSNLKTYRMSLDGTVSEMGVGEVVGYDEDTDIIITAYSQDGQNGLEFFKDGQFISGLVADTKEEVVKYMYSTEGRIYTMSYFTADPHYEVFETDLNKNTNISLGRIEAKYATDKWWEPVQVIADKDDVYVLMSSYEDPGNIWQCSECLSAIVGVKNSMQILYDKDNTMMACEGVMYMEGSIVGMTEHYDGEYFLASDTYGDLMRYDDKNGARLICEDLILEPAAGSGYKRSFQTATYIDGLTFALIIGAQRDPYNDMDVFEAYTATSMDYIMIDENGEETLLRQVCPDEDRHFGTVECACWFVDDDRTQLLFQPVYMTEGHEGIEACCNEAYMQKLADEITFATMNLDTYEFDISHDINDFYKYMKNTDKASFSKIGDGSAGYYTAPKMRPGYIGWVLLGFNENGEINYIEPQMIY